MKENKPHNPIDKDKTTQNPGTLPYAHHVGSAVIKPTKTQVVKNNALSAMQEQTDMQLHQIKEQIELLARQAQEIQNRKELAKLIYTADINFKPIIGHIYHLYQRKDGSLVLSVIGPNEWAMPKFEKHLYTTKLLADHTWENMNPKQHPSLP